MSGFVLVVEDDMDVRETTRMMLEHDGHAVLTACNGADALEVLARHPGEVGLILLDGLMPVMTGWQFLEARSRSEELRRIPTYVLSAAQPAPEVSALATGVLAKPAAAEELMSLARRYCGDR